MFIPEFCDRTNFATGWKVKGVFAGIGHLFLGKPMNSYEISFEPTQCSCCFFNFLSQHESGVSETGVSILTNPVNRWGSALATWQSHRQLGWSNLFLVCLGPLGSKAGVVKTTFRSGTKQDRIGWTLKIVRQPMKSGVKWGYNQQTLIESNRQLTQWKKDGLNILYP